MNLADYLSYLERLESEAYELYCRLHNQFQVGHNLLDTPNHNVIDRAYHRWIRREDFLNKTKSLISKFDKL